MTRTVTIVIPDSWTAEQAMEVCDTLNALAQAVWDTYEPIFAEHGLYHHPLEPPWDDPPHEPFDIPDDVPF